MEEGDERSTRTNRAPMRCATSWPVSRMSAIVTRAPARTRASAKARPRPRAPPVTRTCRSARFIQGAELLPRLRLEHAPHARHAHVVLVEELAAARVRRHVLEQLMVLLEHRPVQAFQPVAVQEAPGVALPAAHLAAAPEEHLRMLRVDRHGEADDEEWPAGAELLLVGNRQPHPVRARLAPLDPVEIQALLAGFLEHQPGAGLAYAELRGPVAPRHRMRLRVQISAVHRIH